MDEILMKIAKGIEAKCAYGGCPCREGCEVYSDKDCLDRIVAWLKKTIETKS